MIFPKLNSAILIFASLCSFVIVMQYHSPLQAAIAPERDVIIVDNPEKSENPAWKAIWDQARKLSREGKFEEAAEKYTKLLGVKPNIEEARWEYCKVLIELKRWADAGLNLENLLEIDPNRTDFLLQAGAVALNNKQYQQATKYFGQVYEKGPFDPSAVEALAGLVSALEGLGKKTEAFPLMQQLYLRTPNDAHVLLRLARLAKDLGWLDKASSYYSILIAKFKVEDRVFMEAAVVYELRGMEENALPYQLKYLDRHPEYLPFQEKVADHYLKSGKKRLALPHLLVLNKQGDGGDDLLVQIGEIYFHDEDRPDKALVYLEKYRNRHPGNRRIKKEIETIQTRLANDLLSIVLNNGAAMLWHDLAKITPNRQAIYEAMSDLLQHKGKDEEQYQVLEIIHSNNPQDKKIVWQLAELSYTKKRYRIAYSYLKLLEGSEAAFPQYLLLRAKIEETLGDDLAALSTLSRYLKENPENLPARLRALKLAGDLGMVNKLRMLYREIPRKMMENQHAVELENIYIEGLIGNRMYSDVEDILHGLLGRFSKRSKRVTDARLRLAESYFVEGQVFQAEQMAREMLADDAAVQEALGRLTQMAFERGNVAWGKAWLYLLAKKSGVDLLSKNYCHWPEEVYFQKVELFVAEHRYQTAIGMLTEYLSQLEKEQPPGISKAKVKAELWLCRLLYRNKQYAQAKNYIQQVLEKNPDEVELLVILEKIGESQASEGLKDKSEHLFETAKLKTSSAIYKAAAYEYEYGAYTRAAAYVHSFLRRIPSSVSARVLEGKILIAQNNYGQALKIFRLLSQEFPKQKYFQLQTLDLEFKLGNFKRLAKEISVGPLTVTASASRELRDDSTNDFFRQHVLLARSLWADGKLDASIKMYQSLLRPPVEKVFLQRMGSTEADFHLPALKRSFWERVTFSNSQNDDRMATVMDPLFIGEHLGLSINAISAALYMTYQWQNLIGNELSAKQTIMRRDYHQAEKEYKALIKKGDSDETLYDLARVYSRLELYGKEGELYEILKKTGTEYPELDEMVWQNTLKTMPWISFDGLFLDEKGRDGYIDIKKRSWGIEGWRMPAFNQELDVQAERGYYTSSDTTKEVLVTKLNGTYTINLSDDTDILINFGGNFADSDANFLYRLQLKGRISESLSGNVAISQDAVDDTVQALRAGIYHRDMETGLKIDYFPKLFLGGDFRYREYTDSNYQSRYHLWSSYDLFGELSLLQLRYDYSTLQNSRSNLGHGNDFSTDFSPDDLPYWSPGSYWQHLLTLRFKHNIETDTKSSLGTSYYTFNYSFGYESEYNEINSVGFNIFLEMSRHYLLKGSFAYYNTGNYTMNAGMLSVIYRW